MYYKNTIEQESTISCQKIAAELHTPTLKTGSNATSKNNSLLPSSVDHV